MSIPLTESDSDKKRRAKIALTAAIIILLSSPCQASDYLDVVINEIAWMGTKIENIESKDWWRYEWFELYNNTSSTISLDGWKLEFYGTELDWTLALKGGIAPKKYFLAVSSNKVPFNFDQNYSDLSGKFFNKGQILLLKDPLGYIVDNIDCSSGWFCGDNITKQTMERKGLLLTGSDVKSWQTSKNPYGTPGENNSTGNISFPSVTTEEENTEKKSKTASSPASGYEDGLASAADPAEESGNSPIIFTVSAILATISGFSIFMLKKFTTKK